MPLSVRHEKCKGRHFHISQVSLRALLSDQHVNTRTAHRSLTLSVSTSCSEGRPLANMQRVVLRRRTATLACTARKHSIRASSPAGRPMSRKTKRAHSHRHNMCAIAAAIAMAMPSRRMQLVHKMCVDVELPAQSQYLMAPSHPQVATCHAQNAGKVKSTVWRCKRRQHSEGIPQQAEPSHFVCIQPLSSIVVHHGTARRVYRTGAGRAAPWRTPAGATRCRCTRPRAP